MKRIFSLLFFLSLLLSCETSPKNERDPHFTSDSEELFFKNLRQSEYLLEENKAAGFNIFTHSEHSEDDPFVIKLIHNWRNDQAFVLLEWKDENDRIVLSSGSEEVIWTGESMKNHNDVAAFLFDKTMSGLSITMNDSAKLKLSDAHMTSIKDYFKLTSRR